MSDHRDTIPASPPADQPAAEAAGQDATVPDECELPASITSRKMMPVEQLTAHPGNVRADLDLTPEFCASIAETGVLTPLLITIEDAAGAAGFRVIDGHRRLSAALQAGLNEVPYDLITERQGDQAGQYLDMFNANHHRKALSVTEEADALFAASDAGATKTRIRKSTGLKAGQVKAALAAATLTGQTRASVEELTRERGDSMTLADLALLAEFQEDPDALRQLMDVAAYHDSLEHQAERLRQERAERAAHDKLRGELEAGGLTITDHLPPGALRLTFLTHEGEQLTAESHATCPGRGAYFHSWDLQAPVHYCADPGAYGHARPASATPEQPAAPAGPGVPPAFPPAEDPEAAASRRLTTQGNRAWRAAAEVRHRWLAEQLLARRAAPREADVFVAQQLLTMPEALRRYLGSAGGSTAFTAVAGKPARQVAETCATAASRKLPLLMLTPVAAAYEHALTVAAGSQDTWQDTRFSPCPYADAGAYFTFLASIGYQLSAIEQAVADSRPWQPGGTLAQVLADQPGEPACGQAGATEDIPANGAAGPDEATSEEQAAA